MSQSFVYNSQTFTLEMDGQLLVRIKNEEGDFININEANLELIKSAVMRIVSALTIQQAHLLTKKPSRSVAQKEKDQEEMALLFSEQECVRKDFLHHKKTEYLHYLICR